jgi:bisphosphoglycerate-independent phosphoglycerate mutase (AlkP superfamily)
MLEWYILAMYSVGQEDETCFGQNEHKKVRMQNKNEVIENFATDRAPELTPTFTESLVEEKQFAVENLFNLQLKKNSAFLLNSAGAPFRMSKNSTTIEH